VALYDGVIRFLLRGDVRGRRVAVKRALAILIHLQARLRMDIGGRPAQVLSELYASMFAVPVQASLGASVERFEEVIGCVRSIPDAWKQVAAETAPAPSLPASKPRIAHRSPPPMEADQVSRMDCLKRIEAQLSGDGKFFFK
jgi:flagellar secretion chaperone FliS